MSAVALGPTDPTPGLMFDPVEQAIAAIAAGRPVVVVDDADREDEGDLVVPAAHATPELVGLMVRHTSGVICVAMPGDELDRLALPPMTATNQDPKGTAYTVSVDARTGITTGISAADRARTIRVLADPASTAADVRRPGHVFPLRAVPGGVLARRGHRSYGIEVARLAGLPPAVLERARQVLGEHERQQRRQAAAEAELPLQMTMFTPLSQRVVDTLAGADLDALTPLQALNLLHELKAEIASGHDRRGGGQP
jgi:3,4-dihydroxy-2-butanone 4-phosphate synthase